MKSIATAILIILFIAAPAQAKPRCVLKYTPSGPIYAGYYKAPPCDDVTDMGYIDNEENSFSEFHFLKSIPQERRDYYSLHLRINRPWRIQNPMRSDDK